MACIEGAAAGELKVGFCLGGNLYGSNPDATFAAEALGNLDLLVYLSTTLNTGHAHGLARETIILPVLARDEEPQPTTQESMFNYIRLSDGGPRRHDGPRSEVDVIALDRRRRHADGRTGSVHDRRSIGRRCGHTAQIRQAIARDRARLRKAGRHRPHEGRIPDRGRTFHEPRFRHARRPRPAARPRPARLARHWPPTSSA